MRRWNRTFVDAPAVRTRAVTLIELLVTITILAIVATIATGVYTNYVRRAKVAACFAEIRQIELACERYRHDTGQYPPSSSGNFYSPNSIVPDNPASGCGYMTLALRQSLSGNGNMPVDPRWVGPYLNLDREQLGTIDGSPVSSSTPLPRVQMLDPWGSPYQYIRFDDYASFGGTNLPASDPFAPTETWYNPSTFQIVSFGPDGVSFARPQMGLGFDDVTNFTR